MIKVQKSQQQQQEEMVTVGNARVDDLLDMQHCNLLCLPTNYEYHEWLRHVMTWPQVRPNACMQWPFFIHHPFSVHICRM